VLIVPSRYRNGVTYLMPITDWSNGTKSHNRHPSGWRLNDPSSGTWTLLEDA
jgi:hypothetical protein